MIMSRSATMIPVIPFRWDVSCPEQLGTLLRAPAAEPAPAGGAYPQFVSDLRDCCAGVLAAACDARDAAEPDLLFVGRSPESLHDYLRGVCFETSRRERFHMLAFSMRRL